jgi:hypothetical protein
VQAIKRRDCPTLSLQRRFFVPLDTSRVQVLCGFVAMFPGK